MGARGYTVSSTLSHRETSREGAWGKCHYVERSYDWRGKKTQVLFLAGKCHMLPVEGPQ